MGGSGGAPCFGLEELGNRGGGGVTACWARQGGHALPGMRSPTHARRAAALTLMGGRRRVAALLRRLAARATTPSAGTVWRPHGSVILFVSILSLPLLCHCHLQWLWQVTRGSRHRRFSSQREGVGDWSDVLERWVTRTGGECVPKTYNLLNQHYSESPIEVPRLARLKESRLLVSCTEMCVTGRSWTTKWLWSCRKDG